MASSGNYWPKLNSVIDQSLATPGNSRSIKYGIAQTSFTPTGYISYSPNNIFNFQIGQNKNFIGNGYRSMILSHNAAPYPYFRINTKLKRFQYTNLFGAFNHYDKINSVVKSTRRKYSAMHTLSWNVHKKLNLYFFEAIVWPHKDSTNHRGFDINYLNPLIFYRPVEYSIGSSDNALMGFGWQFKASPKFRIYSQFILDEFLLSEITADLRHFLNKKDTTIVHGWWANKFGVQLGFKMVDSVKTGLLQIIGEISLARPFTYTHGTITQSYTHANQPLAHPLGTNFFEALAIANYSMKKWAFKTKIIYAFYGRDQMGKNLGGDIFKSYASASKIHGNSLGQGNRNNLWQLELEIAHPVVKHPKIIAFMGYYLRHQKSSTEKFVTSYPFIGLRMGSILKYTDF